MYHVHFTPIWNKVQKTRDNNIHRIFSIDAKQYMNSQLITEFCISGKMNCILRNDYRGRLIRNFIGFEENILIYQYVSVINAVQILRNL